MNHPVLTTMRPELLTLDRLNPRLHNLDLTDVKSENDMTIFMHRHMATNDLIGSIASAGYFQQNPMTVARENDLYIVLDGNRRLAAIRALTDPEISAPLGVKPPLFDASAKEDLQRIPVALTNRDTNWRFALKTHFHDTIAWNLGAKAAYIHHLKDHYGITAQQISKQTGYSRSTILAIHEALELLNQANQQGIFDQSNSALYFYFPIHLLYDALKYPSIREFIGLTTRSSQNQNPVPKAHLPRLTELLNWLYGLSAKPNQQTVIQRAKDDLPKLERVLQNDRALQHLRKFADLQAAIRQTTPPHDQLRLALESARQLLQQADAILSSTEDPTPPSTLGLAKEISAMADDIQRSDRYQG